VAHRLELTLVDERDGAPIADAKAREYSAEETDSVSSDSRGVMSIEWPTPARSEGGFRAQVSSLGFQATGTCDAGSIYFEDGEGQDDRRYRAE